MKVYEHFPLKAWNTFSMDVKARYFAEYDTKDELCELLKQFANEKILHIGCGSNLLFLNDYDGVILHSNITGAEKLHETDNEVLLKVGAGVVFDSAISYMLERGWGGAENLSDIPGEVGASAVQNIGAYGVEVKDIIHHVETIERKTLLPRVFGVAECRYGYRDSIFKNELKDEYIVTAVVFRLQKHAELHLDYGNIRQELQHIEHPTISDVRHAVINIRRQKLPAVSEAGSAGSFFKNPIVSVEKFAELQASYPDIPHYESGNGVKVPAAWLIDKSGMKGKKIGGAMVYEKQPLVIVNTGDAVPEDVVKLAEKVQKKVYSEFGIQIEPEVNYIS